MVLGKAGFNSLTNQTILKALDISFSGLRLKYRWFCEDDKTRDHCVYAERGRSLRTDTESRGINRTMQQ